MKCHKSVCKNGERREAGVGVGASVLTGKNTMNISDLFGSVLAVIYRNIITFEFYVVEEKIPEFS